MSGSSRSALRQGLDDQVFAVAIDDERRQAIGLAVDEAVRGCVDRERLAKVHGPGQPLGPERRVRRLCAVGEQSKRDLRSIAVECLADGAAAGTHDGHRISASRLDFRDVRLVDPGMTGPRPLLAALRNGNGVILGSGFVGFRVRGSGFRFRGSGFGVPGWSAVRFRLSLQTHSWQFALPSPTRPPRPA